MFEPHLAGPACRRDWSRIVAALSLVVAVLATMAWYLPFMQVLWQDYSYADLDSSWSLRPIGPFVVVVFAAIMGLAGSRRAASLAGGLASVVAAARLADEAMVHDYLTAGSESSPGHFSFGIGFWIGLMAGVAGLATFVALLGTLRRGSSEQGRSVSPNVATCGGFACVGMALGWWFPGSEGNPFDLAGGVFGYAYYFLVFVVICVGCFGFSTRHQLGAAAAVGSGAFALLSWAAYLVEGPTAGFFVSDNRTPHAMAVGALVVVICGGIGMFTASPPLDGERQRSPGLDATIGVGDPWRMPPEVPSGSGGPSTAIPIGRAEDAVTETGGSAMLPPSGWHPDPAGRHRLRFWDGTAWTDRVANGSQTGNDPL